MGAKRWLRGGTARFGARPGTFVRQVAGPTARIALALALIVTAQTQARADETSPAEAPVAVSFLNPAASYEPDLTMPLRPPETLDPPKLTDKPTDARGDYHLVVGVSEEVPNAIVEVTIRPEGENEVEVGLMEPIGDRELYELHWVIPKNIPEGAATLSARVYQQRPEGLAEVAQTALEVDLEHAAAGAPIDEAVDMTWPLSGGPLGFYKPRGGSWQTVVEGVVTSGAQSVKIFYSLAPLGAEPEFKPCPPGLGPPPSGLQFPNTPIGFFPPATGVRPWLTSCALGLREKPEDVTAVAAVATGGDEAGAVTLASQEGADVHAIDAYRQEPADMSLELSGVPPFVPSMDQPTGARRKAATGCIQIAALVRDGLNRPVSGANVDLHASGPTDGGVSFPNALNAKPGQGEHSEARTVGCDGNVTATGRQGVHKLPGAADVVHSEAGHPTDKDGRTTFDVYSTGSGSTQITGWIDDAEIPDGSNTRPEDDDSHEPDEAADTLVIQWLTSPLEISLDPIGTTTALGDCVAYRVKVRSGRSAVAGINVDLHATGPSDRLEICSLPDVPSTRAPDRGPADPNPHLETTEKHADHAGTMAPGKPEPAARTLHTEGETDLHGHLVVGLSSPDSGDTSLTAWVDGERGSDNDVLDTGELTAIGTSGWVASMAETDVSFVNPSGYGGNSTGGPGDGTQVADIGGDLRIVARVAGPWLPETVTIDLSADGGTTFHPVGNAPRADSTDSYALLWEVDRPDGPYLLRARIPGTDVTALQPITVGGGAIAGAPNPALEAVSIRSPGVGEATVFVDGATTIDGIASPGAEGADLFYSKVPAADTPEGSDWIPCGYADLLGTGATSQRFVERCTLRGGDQPHQVTAVAALTYDCSVAGCDADPDPSALPGGVASPRASGQKEGGDSLRVAGIDAAPRLGLEPYESAEEVGECKRMEIIVLDQTGQPLRGSNIDVLLEDASPNGSATTICDPGDSSSWRDSTDADPFHDPSDSVSSRTTSHIEAEVPYSGTLVLGVTAGSIGTSSVSAWLDGDDDDERGAWEPAAGALVHWEVPQGCTILGTSASDLLTGTSESDRICGLGGDDTVYGLAGNDLLVGGPGNDSLHGGDGNDSVRGGSGDDTIRGGSGTDTCSGDGGSDDVRACEYRRKRPA